MLRFHDHVQCLVQGKGRPVLNGPRDVSSRSASVPTIAGVHGDQTLSMGCGLGQAALHKNCRKTERFPDLRTQPASCPLHLGTGAVRHFPGPRLSEPQHVTSRTISGNVGLNPYPTRCTRDRCGPAKSATRAPFSRPAIHEFLFPHHKSRQSERRDDARPLDHLSGGRLPRAFMETARSRFERA